MTTKNSYSYKELIDGQGKMFGPGNAQLPLPPMLMFDRIIEINDNQGDLIRDSSMLKWISTLIFGSLNVILKMIL